MGLPKWECPGVSHMKMNMGPNWDLLGIAQVGMLRCAPCENKDGSQLGPTWECPSGSAQVCPMWACQTKCSGSHLGSPHGTNVGNPTFNLRHGTHLGVKWVLVGK